MLLSRKGYSLINYNDCPPVCDFVCVSLQIWVYIIVLVVTLCMKVLTSEKQYGWHVIYFSLWSRHIDSHKLQLPKHWLIGLMVGVGMRRCPQFRHAQSCPSVVTLAFRSSLFLVIGLCCFSVMFTNIHHI